MRRKSAILSNVRVSGDALRAIAIAIAAVSFSSLVCAGGIPSLRHDWVWPVARPSFVEAVLDATSGWGWNGIGYPRAYRNDDLFSIAIAALVDVLGPFAALAVLMFLIAFAMMWATDRLVSLAMPDPVVRFSAAAFALFNPWVYAKIVAGHYAMVLSCAALALLVREACSRTPNSLRASIVIACLLPQLQFFLLALPIAVYLAWRGRFLPIVTSVVVTVPMWIGIASNGPYLASLPFTLEWQNVQSVAPGDALLLVGYFPEYLQAIAWIAYPMLAILALAAAGVAVRAASDRRALWWAALVAAFLFAAMGTRSPLAPFAAALFINVRASAVFRELYDLLGVVALGYAFFAAVAAARWAFARFVFAAAVLATTVAWFVVPPSAYWVDARELPSVPGNPSPNFRVAYMPPVQPFSFHGAGSGADPQTSTLLGSDALAVNEYEPYYPVSAALSSYARDGDDRELAALSVNAIVDRPWLGPGADRSIDATTRAHAQMLRSMPQPSPRYRGVAGALPLLSLAGAPLAGSLNRRIGTGGAFFADLFPDRAVRTFQAPAITPDPDRGWTTVDLATARYPQVAQGIGGTATASDAPLRLQTDAWTLVFISGTLLDGALPRRGADGFAWIPTAPGAHVFRCQGVCALVATTEQRPEWPLEPQPAARYGMLAYRAVTPWWLEVDVPAQSAARTLRFNSSYDGHWVALGAGGPRHLRLDAAVNGWILPPSPGERRIVLLHAVAAAQAAAAAGALIWTFALLATAVYRAVRTRERSLGLPP